MELDEQEIVLCNVREFASMAESLLKEGRTTNLSLYQRIKKKEFPRNGEFELPDFGLVYYRQHGIGFTIEKDGKEFSFSIRSYGGCHVWFSSFDVYSLLSNDMRERFSHKDIYFIAQEMIARKELVQSPDSRLLRLPLAYNFCES